MPNPWFQFKQFTVRQEHAAMKVGTDGVLLGAWTSVPEPGGRVLDVGTGTGLIALMIAQRTTGVHIDAIDIDTSATVQAHENFQNSPWKDCLSSIHSSLRSFAASHQHSYELVVCNPPFFSNSLKTSSKEKNLAKHDDSLALDELFTDAVTLSKKTALFSLILPAEKEPIALRLASEHHMNCCRKTWVIPSQGKPPKRVLLEFSYSPGNCKENSLLIETGTRHEYSEEYKQLTEDFYLK